MRIRTPKKNKSDILKTYLQSETDLTSKINESLFNKFFDILEKKISDHISIELRNFGVFKSKGLNLYFSLIVHIIQPSFKKTFFGLRLFQRCFLHFGQ